jgi:hypothetical protein
MNRKLICPLLLVWSALLAFAVSTFADDSDPPRLSISYSSTNLSLNWPLAASDWILEQAAYLGPSSPWAYVPLTLARTNGTNITLSVSALGRSMFYRLSSINSSTTPIPGLTAKWSFDDGSSELAPDATGYGNGAALANVASGTGRIGPGALWFNGQPAGVGASRATVSNDNYRALPPGPFSVSLWLDADSLATGWRGLIGNGVSTSNGWYLALHNVGPGTNEFVFGSSGSTPLNVTGRKLLLPGQWYELTATYDGSEGRIYVDSQLLARGAGSIMPTAQPIYFGGGVNNYDSFLGLLDEVRIFTNALTHEEVSLTGNWHMNESSGIFVSDSSVRGHRAIVSSSGAWSAGKQGAGIDLNNSTVMIRNDYADVLPPTGGSFSLSFWVFPRGLPDSWSGLMSCANGTNNGWHLAIHSGAPEATRLRFWSTDSGGTLDLSAPITLPSVVWSKIDITFNGGIATVYVNGLKVQSSNGGIQGSTVPIVVGTVPGFVNFNGNIDELRIYRRERDETEIGPVAKVMWETVMLNSSTNLVLQGFGPAGKALTYSIVPGLVPTNGTVTQLPGSGIVTYTAGATKGPDAFMYTVSDGEFTSPATIVTMSIVQPHWLSPTGGLTAPLDGSSPEHAWAAATADAVDAIWHTNNYYDCFFYAPGEYQTRGWHSVERSTCNRGCKHIGAGLEGDRQTTIKLVGTWSAWSEGAIFGTLVNGQIADEFEVRDMVLDCNAVNNPKYTVGEPVSIIVPLSSTTRVETITLHWNNSLFNGGWRFGQAQQFSISTRVPGTGNFVTNRSDVTSTGSVDTVRVDAETDEIVIWLQRRGVGIDFYSLAEIEVAGAAVTLLEARTLSGVESNLDPFSSAYSIGHIADDNDLTVWASGSDNQVRIILPLKPGTIVSQLNVYWNCQTIEGLGHLGPASEYQVQARDATGQYYVVPLVRQPRTSEDLELNVFGTPIVTDQLVLVLNTKEAGVDFYSLRELSLQNGNTQVALKVPRALTTLGWGDYHVLRAFDGDLGTQWTSDTQGSCVAIRALGSNLKFSRLKIVGFGTKATRECFPIGMETRAATALRDFGNVLIEDCTFTDPAPNNTDGLTAVLLVGTPPRLLTNAVVRRCTVTGMRPYFRYSQAFTATHVENCRVSDCGTAVYFEPNPAWGDNVGPVLIRSNQFVNVNNGMFLVFAAGAQFDSVTCIENDIVLAFSGGWAFSVCDTCSPGPSGTITNIAVLSNIVRYSDWSLRPWSTEGGLYCSDIRNAVFGNNIVTIGTVNGLRLRNCPSGSIPPPPRRETCDGQLTTVPPTQGPVFPQCLDTLPPGYQRSWFNNRDRLNTTILVRYWTTNFDGYASQQQWR